MLVRELVQQSGGKLRFLSERVAVIGSPTTIEESVPHRITEKGEMIQNKSGKWNMIQERTVSYFLKPQTFEDKLLDAEITA